MQLPAFFRALPVSCFFFLSSPREKKVRAEKDALEAQLSLLNHQMDDVQDVLSDLQQRDDNMYRVVVEADPLPSVRNYREMRRNIRNCVINPLLTWLSPLPKDGFGPPKIYAQSSLTMTS